jgi:hypothetical protein
MSFKMHEILWGKKKNQSCFRLNQIQAWAELIGNGRLHSGRSNVDGCDDWMFRCKEHVDLSLGSIQLLSAQMFTMDYDLYNFFDLKTLLWINFFFSSFFLLIVH